MEGISKETFISEKNWKTCYPYVERNGTWLVYATMQDGFLKINMCGISRPFDRPIAPMSDSDEINQYAYTIGLEKMSQDEFFCGMLKLNRLDLANEINALRKRRDMFQKPTDNKASHEKP